MRISTSMQYTSQLRYMQSANTRLDKASEKYNTGLKFQNSGEDPSGMSQKIKYTGDISAFEQYKLNSHMVAGYLSEEETALGSIWTALSSAQSRLHQAVNGTHDKNSLTALAEDIEQTINQLYDSMNTRNAEGEYIFAGSDSSRPAFTLASDGNYYCQANGSVRYVQVSPTVVVQSSDSALNVFQNVPLSHTMKDTANPAITSSYIENFEDFNDLYNQFYSSKTGANNDITIEVNGGKFEVKSPNGNVIGGGEVTKKGVIEYKGMVFETGDQNYNGNITVTLDKPKKDNILNTLTNVVKEIKNGNLGRNELTQMLSEAQISVSNCKDNVDMYRGQVGARAANIDNIITSNESLSVVKQTARAGVTEIDAYEAVSELLMVQNALQVSQSSFAKIHQSNLFDYI